MGKSRKQKLKDRVRLRLSRKVDEQAQIQELYNRIERYETRESLMQIARERKCKR